MGTYTEIIFGARLKKSTPKNIIDTLRFVANGPTQTIHEEDPVIVYDKELIEKYNLYYVMRSASYYFGVCEPVSKMWFNEIAGEWVLSFRANCKNYDGKLEEFVEWIKPYIKSGTGYEDIYAIITVEEGRPIMYGKHANYKAVELNDEV